MIDRRAGRAQGKERNGMIRDSGSDYYRPTVMAACAAIGQQSWVMTNEQVIAQVSADPVLRAQCGRYLDWLDAMEGFPLDVILEMTAALSNHMESGNLADTADAVGTMRQLGDMLDLLNYAVRQRAMHDE